MTAAATLDDHPAAGRQTRVSMAGSWVVERPILTSVVIALLVRSSFAVASFVANPYTLIPDEEQYIQLARTVARGAEADSWMPFHGQALYSSTWAFTAPVRVAFEILPDSRLVAQLVAVAYGVAVVALTVRLAREVVRAEWALAVGVVLAVVPSQVLWSSVALRESAVWLGLVAVGLGVAVVGRPGRSGPLGLGLVLAGLAALGALRDQTMVVATWAACIALVVHVRRAPAQAVVTVFAAVLLPVSFGLGIAGLSLVRDAAPVLGRTRTALAADADSAFAPTISAPPTTTPGPADTSSTTLRGDAAGDPGVTPTPPTSDGERCDGDGSGAMAIAEREACEAAIEDRAIIPGSVDGTYYYVDDSAEANLEHLPTGLVAVALRPFPWESTPKLDVLFARLENIGWYVLYVAAAAGVWLGRDRLRALAYPAVLTVGIIVVAALTQGNLGTSFRHRGQILWALALLAAVCGQTLLDRRRRTVPTEASR